MSLKTLAAALAAATLLAACAQTPPPPRPAPVPVAAPAPPTGDGRVAGVRFEPGNSNLTAEERSGLTPVLNRLATNPRSPVTITSYSERANFATSRARGAAVRAVLMENGVASSRIRVVTAGMLANADPNVVQVQVR